MTAPKEANMKRRKAGKESTDNTTREE